MTLFTSAFLCIFPSISIVLIYCDFLNKNNTSDSFGEHALSHEYVPFTLAFEYLHL